MERNLVILRQWYRYFNNNKTWILSFLFILSILKASIWYACFGINILSYSNLQDIFISFAEYFMSIIAIGMTIICLSLFPVKIIENKFERMTIIIIGVVTIIVISIIFMSLFKTIVSLMSLICLVCCFSLLYLKNKKIFISLIIFFFLVHALIEPLLQYSQIEKDTYNRFKDGIKIVSPYPNSKKQNAYVDRIAFDYHDVHIDTKEHQYYFIGSNSNYYFILDTQKQESLIVPKNECINIKAKPFQVKDIFFFR